MESGRRRRIEPISNRTAWNQGSYASDQLKSDRIQMNPITSDKANAEIGRHSSAADRVASLKSYRGARGLCDRCAEKWFLGHKCANTVQLHVIDEVWDLLSPEEECNDRVVETKEQIFLALSTSAWTGAESVATLRLHGSIQQMQLEILIDSGSSHTFISDRFSAKLSGVQSLR